MLSNCNTSCLCYGPTMWNNVDFDNKYKLFGLMIRYCKPHVQMEFEMTGECRHRITMQGFYGLLFYLGEQKGKHYANTAE